MLEALQDAGCSVVELPFLPDPCGRERTRTATFLLAGKMGMTYLFVVKEPTPNTLLTPIERDWIRFWRGTTFVVETAEQALGCLNQSLDNLTSS